MQLSLRRGLLESLMVFALLIMIAVGPWAFGLTHTLYLGLSLAGLGLLAAVNGVRYILLSRREVLDLPPGLIVWCAFVLFALVRTIFSESPSVGRMDVIGLAGLGVAYWIWHDVAVARSRWKWAVSAVMLSVSIMAWYALIQDARGSTMVLTMPRPEDYGMRASGAYACPNHFAQLLGMIIPFSVALVFTKGAGLPLRLISGYTVLVSLVPLYLSGSRSGWMGMMAGVLVVVVGFAGKKSWRMLLVTLVLAPVVMAVAGYAIWLFSPLVQERIAEAMKGNVRLDLWADSLRMIQERPWFGFGLGTYRWVYLLFQGQLHLYIDPEFAHNEYIHYASELGLVGLALAGVAVLVWLVTLVQRYVRSQDALATGLLIGGAGVLAGTLVHSFFDFNFHIYANPLTLVFLLAVTFAVSRSRMNKSEDNRQVMNGQVHKSRVTGLLAVLIGVGLAYHVVRITVSGEYVIKGRSAREDLQIRDAHQAFQRAVVWDSLSWQAQYERGELAKWQSFWLRAPVMKEDMLATAEQAYRQALAINPFELGSVHGLAVIASMRGDEEAEVSYLMDLVRRQPLNPYFRVELGERQFRAGHYEAAIEHLSAALKLKADPEARALLNEARTRHERGE